MTINYEINRLKKEKNAVILAHNYQIEEVQDIADFVGDSLELSYKAAESTADVIVFCGVHFMAESAKIISPQKTVLLPEKNAGCPLADMVTPDALQKFKLKYPDAEVVCYINSSAAVKALSDICCTSSNAVKIVNSLNAKKIIFIPDKNLGRYVSSLTNKELILWDGYCRTHNFITVDEIKQAKKQHPSALFVAHPECPFEVLKLADKVASTSGIIKFVRESNSNEFIIGTEMGILHRLKKENPQKKFFLASSKLFCYNMKVTNLNSVLNSLQEMKNKIEVDEQIRIKAKETLERMLAVK